MDPWIELEQELDSWRRTGRRAGLWWRDDDLVEPSAALERLLGMARDHRLGVGLAVVPAELAPALGPCLRGCPAASVLQHGFAHRNHAPAGEKAAELGAHRPLATLVEELRAGRERLAAAFDGTLLPILAPPWNRIAPTVVATLPALGYRGLSTFSPRQGRRPVRSEEHNV